MKSPLAQQVRAWFEVNGPLHQYWPGFRPREVQQTLALAVAEAIESRASLVAEAGTGTGKTLAYLVPALLAGRRTLVSTGSRTLQSQLGEHVLPLLTRELGFGVKSVLLKGRHNYLCLYRLQAAYNRESDVRSRQAQRLMRTMDWAERTESGDLSELGDPGDGDAFWARISSTADNCLGSDCPDYARCHVVKARRAAQSADLIVVNHHLLLADFALREEGFGEILPGVDVLILDEAHHLPEIAGQFFGQRLGHRQLPELLGELRDQSTGTAASIIPSVDLPAALTQAVTLLAQVLSQLAGASSRFERASLIETPLAALLEKFQLAWLTLTHEVGALIDQGPEVEQFARRLHQAGDTLARWLSGPEDQIAWIERNPQGFALCLTPHDVSGKMQTLWQGEKTWVLTSATLAVGDSFAHFTSRLGLEPAHTLRLDSPYDYPRNAMLYLPPALPDPNLPGYTQAVLEASLPLLQAAGGGAFVLCTSQRAVKEAASWLRTRLENTLLVQGEAAREELLRCFRENGHAILVGTHSFWEGVDVRGPALRLVVIDRLPFATPDDPVQKARDELVRREGGNPFTELHLPRAVLMLKQGAGRLIRDETDRGVLMIADPRLQSRPYGRLFLRSLPPMRQSRQATEVCDFLAALAGMSDAVHQPLQSSP